MGYEKARNSVLSQELEMQSCGKIREEPHELVKRGILVEVARVKAHRTKKEQEKMTQYERFVTEGNEKADELVKAGAMLGEGFLAEVRAAKEGERKCT